MTIILRWAEDIENVVVWEFKESWSWEEVLKVGPQSTVMIESSSERVDVMMLVLSTEIPAGAFDYLGKLARSDFPINLGIVVLVNATSAGQTMVKISTKMNDVSIWKFADTYDEAKRLIEADRRQGETTE